MSSNILSSKVVMSFVNCFVIHATFFARSREGYGQCGHHGGGAPGRGHVRAPVGEGEAQQVVIQRLLRIVTRNTKVIGAPDTDPAHPSLLGLLDGEPHGEVAHCGPEAVVALHQGRGGCFANYGWLGIRITYLEISDLILSKRTFLLWRTFDLMSAT